MLYTLTNKKTPLLDIDIDTNSGVILKITNIYNTTHLPVGIKIINNQPDTKELSDWWKNRSIPASREHLREILKKINISSPQELLTKNFGLSLSDQYWIKPHNSNIEWE